VNLQVLERRDAGVDDMVKFLSNTVTNLPLARADPLACFLQRTRQTRNEFDANFAPRVTHDLL